MATTTLEASRAERVRADLEKLQGVWVTVSGRRHTELIVAGRRFTFRFVGGAVYMGTFELNPDEQPRTIDMRIEEGPAKHRGRTARCIYEFDGDLLRWCPTEPGSADRLIAFPPVADGRYLCTLFRRE